MNTQHILPIADAYPHRESVGCSCEPDIIREGPNFIIVHHSFDGREAVEWANQILAEAAEKDRP